MEQFLQIVLDERCVKAIFVLICIAASLSMIGRAKKYQVFGKTAGKVSATWKRFLSYSSEAAEKRIREEERLQREEGNREKKNVFYRMDEMLIHTGIRKRLPFLTVEMMLLFCAAFFFIVVVIFTEFTGSILLGIAAAGILYMLSAESIRMLIRFRQRKVEDNILHFANLMENYARTSDDIVSIFHKISIYLDEPLRSAVEKCYMETYTTGDFAAACSHLDISIGNRYFSDMLTNIEICSRHRANYEEVIHGNKEIVRKYLSERDVRQEMARNARIEIGIMAVIGGWTLSILNSMFSGGLFRLLLGSIFGNAVLAVLVLIALYVLHAMLSINGEEN